jgi:hypothetical protein
VEVHGLKSAKEISESLLEETRVALLGDDFEAFAQCVHVPHFIASTHDKKVLETREDLHDIFRKVIQDYASKGITELIRICDVAEYRSTTRIEATHITHMMAGNNRIGDPFPVFSILELIDGRWKISSSQYAVEKTTMVGFALDAQRLRSLEN